MEPYLDGDEIFLANVRRRAHRRASPGHDRALTKSDEVGLFLAVTPDLQLPHRLVRRRAAACANSRTSTTSDLWINAGYFVFRREIFDYLGEGEDLVEEPFHRLIARDSCSPIRTTASGRRWTR